MVRRFVLAGCLAALASAAQAQAQQPRPLSRAQHIANADKAFANIDTNHDGTLSTSELQAAEEKAKQQFQAALRSRMEAQFRALDTNRDGQLSQAEFLAITPPVKTRETPQQIVQMLDKNRDGKVSADEFKSPRLAAFNKADTNHDGILSVQEQQAAAAGKK